VVGEIRLFGSENRKARMAREQTRIAAEEIAFAVDGSQLFAERGVESSLLPSAGPDPGDSIGPFAGGEPIHFVSTTLSGKQSSSVLVFEGDVRGWQGERNLAAQRITVDQVNQTLRAEEDVSARMPRQAGLGAVRQSDFLQITSGELDYSEVDSEGVFRGAVRVQVSEGWMESEEVRVRMAEDGGGIVEVLAVGEVRLEFRRPSKDGGAPQIMTGKADRLVYNPEDDTIWLIGENAPASVHQAGEEQGTTTGRVLRYQLELGTLEVDSGEGGPATIRTIG
jgi:lipopolysaccharide transport protein LptA